MPPDRYGYNAKADNRGRSNYHQGATTKVGARQEKKRHRANAAAWGVNTNDAWQKYRGIARTTVRKTIKAGIKKNARKSGRSLTKGQVQRRTKRQTTAWARRPRGDT